VIEPGGRPEESLPISLATRRAWKSNRHRRL
jgi:hypothetical protein